MAHQNKEVSANKKRQGRRRLIAALGAGAGAALLPSTWTRPVADVVNVPLHAAQASPPPPSPPPPSPPPPIM